MTTPGLILTADDYGLNSACNRAIRHAVKEGLITSVHVLMNLVTEDEMQRLIEVVAENDYRCGIGLHINTTYGKASLQKAASFKHTWDLNTADLKDDVYTYRGLNTYVHKATDPLEMNAEIVHQFWQLAEYLGGPDKIDAISSHQNIHFWSPLFLTMVNTLAKPFQIPVRSPLRWVSDNQTPQPPYYPSGKGNKGIGPLRAVGLKKIETAVKIPSTGNLLKTAMSATKLKQAYASVMHHGSGLTPRNASGHWFGQPSWEAMRWFITTLSDINHHSGYASEIYMHLADSLVGNDHRFDYSQVERMNEYHTLLLPDFKPKFLELLAEKDVRHGSYRAILTSPNDLV